MSDVDNFSADDADEIARKKKRFKEARNDCLQSNVASRLSVLLLDET